MRNYVHIGSPDSFSVVLLQAIDIAPFISPFLRQQCHRWYLRMLDFKNQDIAQYSSLFDHLDGPTDFMEIKTVSQGLFLTQRLLLYYLNLSLTICEVNVYHIQPRRQ
jgi:hypothetical protein